MGAVPKKTPSAVPSALDPANSLPINSTAQAGPYEPMTGSSNVPYVPGGQGDEETPAQPSYATTGKIGQTLQDGSTGAPSVPEQTGALWTQGPIDPHYTVPSDRNVYANVNNPPTRGRYTWIKAFANHVFNGKQDVDNAGWQQNSPQQRTSYIRMLLPPRGNGYSPESYVPNQLPQQPRTQQFLPTIGTDAPGVNILNSSTYGAGQTAGGIGGNSYTPPASPPSTNPVAPPQGDSGMPTWG